MRQPRNIVIEDILWYGSKQRRLDMELVLGRCLLTFEEKLGLLTRHQREVYEARAQGETYAQIAQRYDVTTWRVRHVHQQALRSIAPPLDGEDRGAAALIVMLQRIRDDLLRPTPDA